MRMRHYHDIVDNDPHFTIDVETRVITNASGKPPSLMQHDHKSERFTFKMPRMVENHDVMECDKVEIQFQNKGSGTSASVRSSFSDKYEVADLRVNPDDPSQVIFTWLIEQNATGLAGSLSFQVTFICYSETEEEYDFAWSTDVYSGVTIRAGIGVDESLVSVYPDVFERLDARIALAEDHAISTPIAIMDDGEGNITSFLSGTLTFTDDSAGNVRMMFVPT